MLVNGKAWPVLDVEPRKYRFRLLNASDSRFYNLFFAPQLAMHQIGSDGGLLAAPVRVNRLLLSPAARADADQLTVEIDVLDPQAQALHLAQSRAVEQPEREIVNPGGSGQQAIHLGRLRTTGRRLGVRGRPISCIQGSSIPNTCL